MHQNNAMIILNHYKERGEISILVGRWQLRISGVDGLFGRIHQGCHAQLSAGRQTRGVNGRGNGQIAKGWAYR